MREPPLAKAPNGRPSCTPCKRNPPFCPTAYAHCSPPAAPPAAGVGPFELPPEADWGRLRLEEKQRKREWLEAQHCLPVDQKVTLSSRMHATVDPQSPASDELRALLKEEEGGSGHAAAEVALPDYVRRHRENMRDYIAKKRQIFLVQMSLDTKRTEISKLDQRSRQRAEALQVGTVFCGGVGRSFKQRGWLTNGLVAGEAGCTKAST